MDPVDFRFLGEVKVTFLRGRWRRIEQEIRYERYGSWIIIPRGFITDFASIPRVFWTVLSPDDERYIYAALVHDRLYEQHGELNREAADYIFWEAMGATERTPKPNLPGVSEPTRYAMWAAVRIFGQSAWDSGTERHAERLRVVKRYTGMNHDAR